MTNKDGTINSLKDENALQQQSIKDHEQSLS